MSEDDESQCEKKGPETTEEDILLSLALSLLDPRTSSERTCLLARVCSRSLGSKSSSSKGSPGLK